jgi:hypothetical protein
VLFEQVELVVEEVIFRGLGRNLVVEPYMSAMLSRHGGTVIVYGLQGRTANLWQREYVDPRHLAS